MIDTLMPLIKQFMPFAQKRMGFSSPPKLFLRGDSKNAENPLGKTAHYDPGEKSITIYITGRLQPCSRRSAQLLLRFESGTMQKR